MTPEQENVIKKVQKLFRLAGSTDSDMEAQNAALRAREILGKYNLSLGDVEGFSEEECGEESIPLKGQSLAGWVKILSSGVAAMFSCKAMFTITRCYRGNGTVHRKSHTLIFVGIRPDNALAARTYNFLAAYCARRTRAYGYTPRQISEYKLFFAYAIKKRADEEKERILCVPQENALVPLKDSVINDYLERAYAHMKTTRRVGGLQNFSGAGQQGLCDGQSVIIHDPITAQNSGTPLRLRTVS